MPFYLLFNYSFFLNFIYLFFLYSRFLLVIYFIHISVYMSIPISQWYPWMDLEGIMLSEISQTEKDKYCVISLTCGI